MKPHLPGPVRGLWMASDLVAVMETLPQGVYDGAHRYDTDDEHVLHVWRDEQSWDIRWPRAVQP